MKSFTRYKIYLIIHAVPQPVSDILCVVCTDLTDFTPTLCHRILQMFLSVVWLKFLIL